MKPGDFWEAKAADGPSGWAAYWATVQAPHRTALVDALRTVAPFDSLLEVGCGPGVNLWRIHQAFPDADIVGMDIANAAIDYGSEIFARADLDGTLQGSGRVTLCAAALPDDLAQLPVDDVDVVLSCYALAYLPPEALDVALGAIVTIARQGIVLAEPMVEPGFAEGLTSRLPEWRHDFLGWFREHAPGWRIALWPMPPVDRLSMTLIARRG